ncbi:MAG: response regulator [Gammaproteobacteria bacterium]|nr:response regulator [Gammaproteobacteria bacterium]MCW8983251.1 response regulator [Gammaproteobacteria bacterium]
MSKYHILCVEDEEMSLELLVEFLSELDDIEISTADDGPACLTAVGERRPDLILLDIKMPTMSGFDVCKILQASPETKAIPIIFLSGFAMDREIEEAMSCGGVGYLTKPFSVSELLDLVTAQIEAKVD